MEEKIPKVDWLIKCEPEKLLHGRMYYPIGNQILFQQDNQFIITQISEEEEYTIEQYNLLPEGAPYQLIHGKLIFMTSPKFNHQDILMNLNRQIDNFVFDNKLGKVLLAPMSVKFDERNVLQPDLLFVSIKRKAIIEEWIMGAPDFVVEILSKSTEKNDRTKKMETYGKYEVIEYWIVNLKAENIEVYHNQDKQMQLVQTAEKDHIIVSKAIEGFQLEVSKIF